ncbi:HipA family kinase [Marinobacter sp. M1N3S26]|uniref:HipA family kinase n=1 Tax=Marinobacter sp. M1N3S26 TaxID=3382299 RepID=UPI00387A8D2D
MEPIGYATLYTQPRQLTGLGNISEIWIADALSHEGDVRLYIKRATNPEILAECLSALLARQLDLPSPRVFVVADPERLIDGDLFVGSEDAGSPSIKQRLESGDPAVEKVLRKWEKLHQLTLFDEWIANPDRNLGNLLWGGGDDWNLIDHAYSLWSAMDEPRPRHPVTNKFAEIVKAFEGDLGPARLRREWAEFGPRCEEIDHTEIQTASQCERFGMSERSENTLSCLKDRLNQMPNLIARHGDQMDLLP